VKCRLDVFLLLFVCFLACLAPSLNKSAVGLTGHLLCYKNRCRSQQDTGQDGNYTVGLKEKWYHLKHFTVAEICNITIHSSNVSNPVSQHGSIVIC